MLPPDRTVARFTANGILRAIIASVIASFFAAAISSAEEAGERWLTAKAHVVPKETAPEGEGYFSIVEGHNGRLYIGWHANAVNSWLVEFDPRREKMKVVVDAHEAIGADATGFAAQSKIHTRNNVGQSGKIYFGNQAGLSGQGRCASP